MNTRVTVRTTADQEMVIGLRKTGHLTKASQVEVREYFDELVAIALGELSDEVDRMLGEYRSEADSIG